MDESIERHGTATANHQPFIIKVKKTSADSWHIEHQESENESPIREKKSSIIGAALKKKGKAPLQISGDGNSTGHANITNPRRRLRDRSRDASTGCTKSSTSGPLDGASLPSMVCNKHWMGSSSLLKNDDNIADFSMTCRQCGSSSQSLSDFVKHIKESHYVARAGRKRHVDETAIQGGNGPLEVGTESPTPDKVTRLSSREQPPAEVVQSEPMPSSVRMAPKYESCADEALPETSGDGGVHKESCDVKKTEVCRESVEPPAANTGTFTKVDQKQKLGHGQLPVGRVSPFVKHEKYSEPDAPLDPPPLDNLGLSDLLPMHNNQGLSEQVTCSASGSSTSSRDTNSGGKTKDPKKGCLGAKLDSIVSNLRENTASVPKMGKTAFCNEGENQLHESTVPYMNSNDQSNSGGSFLGRLPTNGPGGLCGKPGNFLSPGVPGDGCAANNCSHGHGPCFPEGHHTSMMCDDRRNLTFPRPSYNKRRFQDLQSLIASGCVTMPDNKVLQTINCDQERWNVIQGILHEAFSVFPYLTVRESQSLARRTGLTARQVKALFVVARLQHGISWEQDEIDNARRILLSAPDGGLAPGCSSVGRFKMPLQNRFIVPRIQPMTSKLQQRGQLTPEQCDILRWSYTTIPLSENELSRLEEVTKLPKRTILMYFEQLQHEIGSPAQKPLVRTQHQPDGPNQRRRSRQHSLGDTPGLESLEKLKRTTNHVNNCFKTSQFLLNNGSRSNMLNNAPKT